MSDATRADAAYQGAPGAFSEDAARALLGARARLRPCATLDETFAVLTSGETAAAVVPIENTLAGPVPACADLVARHDVRIVGERVLRIGHALLAAPGVGCSTIRRVFSHPVAIAQCEEFFRAHPAMTPVPAFDTAGAVAEVVREGWTDAAAIAGVRAADVYGAVVLAREIQDAPDNFTRFLLLARGAADVRFEPGCKTSLVCVLPNTPGALAAALAPFAARALNLTRIESRPVRRTPFEYAFHLDVAAGDGTALPDAIAALRAAGISVRVLGHYPADSRLRS